MAVPIARFIDLIADYRYVWMEKGGTAFAVSTDENVHNVTAGLRFHF